MLRILLHIRIAELIDYTLYLVAFAWEAEGRQELSNCLIDGLALVLESRRVDGQNLLVHLVWRRQVLSDGELAEARRILQKLDYASCSI